MLSEQLLSDWTGLNSKELEHFYLEYKTQDQNAFMYKNNEQLKQDILNFKKKYDIQIKLNKIPERPNPPTTVSKLIHLWEIRIKHKQQFIH